MRNRFLQVDEIRQAEDYDPVGFNFVTLGLGDVLLNPETMEIFTPNTGQMSSLETGESRADIPVELRYNHNHDSKGRFASGRGGGSSGKSSKSVDKSVNSGVQYGKGKIKNDFNGKPYNYPELKLPKKEYGTVIRQIDDYYSSKYEGKAIGIHSTIKYSYKFEIRGYNDYNIFAKWEKD